uniref:Si:ch73-233m11.2 n=1 Tax=Lates calcarifer TaxID=8187 RepID=A0A4W6E8I0_LATCA
AEISLQALEPMRTVICLLFLYELPSRISTLLGGDPPISVINNNKYITQVTPEAQVTDRNVDDSSPSLDHAIHTALSGQSKTVILMGPEGSGKTTTLEKLVVDWAKGEHLQNFSYVFYFRVRVINSLEGALSLETLMQHHHIPPESMPLVLQKPEDVLCVFDDLDQYKVFPDPSAHTLCSDPSQAVSVSCLIASLLHGSLLKGAAFVVATRPKESLEFPNSTRMEVLGFLKPQREAYFNGFFTDPATANKALTHMERTLGFYDFCTSPRFCWTVCSIYKILMDAGAELPETLTQLHVDILVHLIQALNEARVRELVLALGRMELDCFSFHRFLSSVGAFLQVDGDLDSDACVFSFTSQLMQEFLLAVCFFLDKSEGVEKMLEKHKGHVKFLDLFLSGLSEPVQRRPLETLLEEFNSDQITDFKRWFKSSSEETLKGCYKHEHHRCFHLLHQAHSKKLVKEIITPSAQTGISYGDLSLQDCVALTYVVTCLGEMELLNLYGTRDFTKEKAEALAPAMSLSHKIFFSGSSLSTGAVSHLASALSRGITKELDLSYARLGDEKFKILCAGLRDCKLLLACRLTEASCDELVSVLTSGASQLYVLFDSELTGACCRHLTEALMSEHWSLTELELSVNDLGQEGALLLCQGLSQTGCPLEKLGLKRCELTQPVFKELGSLLKSGTSRLKSLIVGINKVGNQGVKHLWDAVAHPSCLLEELDVEMTDLTDACVEDLCAAVRASKTLKILELRNNSLTDVSVPALIQVMQDSHNMQEMNLKYNDFSDEVLDMLYECDKIRY